MGCGAKQARSRNISRKIAILHRLGDPSAQLGMTMGISSRVGVPRKIEQIFWGVAAYSRTVSVLLVETARF